MSKNALRGFATGMFVASAMIAIYYYLFFHPVTKAPIKQTSQTLTQADVDTYLSSHGQIAMDEATYESMQNQLKQNASSSGNSTSDAASNQDQGQTSSSSTSNSNTSNSNSGGTNSSSTDASKTNDSTSSPSQTVTKLTLKVTAGMTVWDVATTLEQNHIIKDKQVLYNYMLQNKWDTKLQLGTFDVSSDMSSEQIAKIITRQ